MAERVGHHRSLLAHDTVRNRATIIGFAVLTGCADAPRVGVSPLPALPCFAPESLSVRPLVFGAISRADDESGDYSGLEVRFVVDSLRELRALVRIAEGGLPPARPVDSFGYDPARDSIWFSVRADTGSIQRYSYRPGCDRLTGIAQLWISAKAPQGALVVADTLPRVLEPPADNP
jgi:hypothetical protein